MKKRTDESQDRRTFFRTFGRIAVLGGLGFLVAALKRRGRIDPEAHRCINKSVCAGCDRFVGCILPAAQSAKQAEGAHHG